MSHIVSDLIINNDSEQPVEELVSLEVNVNSRLMPLLAVVKSSYNMLILLRMCNKQGVPQFKFVKHQSHMHRLFSNNILLTRAERQSVVGRGLTAKLVMMLSFGTSCYLEQNRNRNVYHKQMLNKIQRITSKMASTVLDKIIKDADELYVAGKYAEAIILLKQAINFGHLPSRALMAWILIRGKKGVVFDHYKVYELAEEGMRYGCHHCKGIMALCYWHQYGFINDYNENNKKTALQLARESSDMGSRYGQFALGYMYDLGIEGHGMNYTQAFAFYKLASAQGLDRAQYELGTMCEFGHGVENKDINEALRLYHLAAAQGHPDALASIARCYQNGNGVIADKTEAIRWYTLAESAGYYGTNLGMD